MPRTLALQAPFSVGFFQAKILDRPFPSPEAHPNPEMKPMSLASPALAGRFFTMAPPGKPSMLIQFSSVAQSCPTLCDPMNRSTPGLPVRHQLPEFTQIHVHRVSDAIQPSHPPSSPSPLAFNLSQHQGPYKGLSSLHQLAKVLELQLQHQSFQRTPRTDLL